MTRHSSPAKSTRPQTPRALPRLRLFEQLDQGRARRATWIAASPGAGKTTLVCSYLDARKLPCLWYQIDADDRDPATFFYHLGLAVARAAPRYRRALPTLTPEYLTGIPTFTRNFFREIARRLDPPRLLVFDNLQEVDPAAPLYEVLREGLSELPEGLQGVLISRSEPTANFARMRVSGHLTVLDWDALRLRPEEAMPFLERLDHRAALSSDVAAHLHEQCAGWAAGLILLHQGVTKAASGHAVFDAASAQHTFDYFATEVFARRPPAVQELLMLTALFPSFTGTMAERISGNAKAAVWLDDLVQSHHFTERRSGSGGDYQYHPLFRSFLLAQARETWGVAELARRSHQAAVLLEEAGRAEEALALYLDAQDWGAATRLILQHAPAIMAAGRFLTLGAAIRTLPAAALEAEPWLSYWLGVCTMLMNPGNALALFETAFERFERDQNPVGAYLTWAAACEAIGFQMADYGQFGPWLERLERLTEAYPEFPSVEIEARVLGGALMAYMWHQAASPFHARWMQRAATLAHICDHPATCARLIFSWLFCAFWFGTDSAAVAAMNERADSLMSRLADAPFEQILLKHAQTTLFTFNGDIEHALAAMEAGLATSTRSGVHLMDAVMTGMGAWSCLGAGRLAAADALLQRMQARVEVFGCRLDHAFHHILTSWRAALSGDFPTALHHVALCVQGLEEMQPVATLINTLLTQALYQIEVSELDAARNSLARADELLGDRPDGHLRYQRTMVAALLACAGQCATAACELLGQAVRMGHSSYIGLLPAAVARLCALALERNIEADAARTLIRRLQLTPPDNTVAEWPRPIKIITLGAFVLLHNDVPLVFGAKAQRKPLDLLKILIALGGHEVAQDYLTEILWADAESGATQGRLRVTVHRLRKLLGDDRAILVQGGTLSLNPQYVGVDVWSLEALCEQAEQHLKQVTPDDAALEILSGKLLALYRGHFLEKHGDPSWALPLRKRSRSKLVRTLAKIDQQWETTRRHHAITLYQRGLELDPGAEDLSRRLMLCRQGN